MGLFQNNFLIRNNSGNKFAFAEEHRHHGVHSACERFRPLHAFFHKELDSLPVLHLHEKWQFFGIARVISAVLGGQWPLWHRVIL
jgi:hypothetical protein